MYRDKTIALLLPARNEALSLPAVLNAIPKQIDRVLVVDNGSTDATAKVAREHGAEVVSEPTPGYGNACLAGIADIESHPLDIVAFADADGSDDISRLPDLLDPIVKGEADLVIEKRIAAEPGVFSLQQRFGNRLAVSLMRLRWGHRYADLGPMRAIAWDSLRSLGMADQDYGWTVEMQIKALKVGLRVKEHPMLYRKRSAGRSKVSRSFPGSLKAGIKILRVIFREALGASNSCGRTFERAPGGRMPQSEQER